MLLQRVVGGRAAPAGRDDALDGIRGISAVGIVLFHISARWIVGGQFAVDLFFVLSGFLITGILTREIDSMSGLDLKRFHIRRARRLCPGLLAMLAVSFAVAQVRPEVAVSPASALCAVTFQMDWCGAFEWTVPGSLGHCWTLAVEYQFYVLWPLVLMAVLVRRRMATSMLLLAAVTGWRCWLLTQGASSPRLYCAFDTHMDGLLVGALLALVDGRRLPVTVDYRGRVSLPAVSLALAAAAVFAVLAIDIEVMVHHLFGITLSSLVGAGLVACARRPGWLRTLLAWSPFATAGRLSYGIYLWHYPVIAFCRSYLDGYALLVPVLGGTTVLAMLSYRFIEQPALRPRRHGAGAARPIMAGA